jgi:hypothetical protein
VDARVPALLALSILIGPAAQAASVGDLVVTGPGRAALAVQEGAGAREHGSVQLLRAGRRAETVPLGPGSPTSLPGLAAAGGTLIGAWRAGRRR